MSASGLRAPVSTSIAGFQVTTASRRELIGMATDDAARFRTGDSHYLPQLVFDVNGHAISLRVTDQSYRQAVEKATLIHADGGFIVALSRWKGARIQERSATTDMLHDFARDRKLSFYLLGATESVNAGCADRLKELYPGINIVGRRHGFFREDEEADLIAEINRAAPDILWVGLGKPKEQIFSVKHRAGLRVGWIVTCGGCFNYVTGHYGRAPQWMQRSGLEWVYRAVTDPRLLWRYLTTTPHALWLSLRA